MNAIICKAGAPETLLPLTCTRGVADCVAANRTVLELQQETLQRAGFALGAADRNLCLYLRGDAWLSEEVLAELRQATAPMQVLDHDGVQLAWLNTSEDLPPAALELNTDAKAAFRLVYPWDLLKLNEILVGGLSQDRIEGEVCPGVVIEGHVEVGEGTRLLPGVYIEGNAVIGRNCKIGPNCYIRGNTSIADGCHVGQSVEVKNSILMAGASVGHLSYCGDSIVGEKVNFGAGTITSNFRHDGGNHRSMVMGKLVDTGRRKFGAIFGDRVHTGIHTSIYPGRKIWAGQMTLPGAVVKYDVVE